MSKFQIVVIALFIIFIIVGVIAFATYKGVTSGSQLPPITIWGTFPADEFNIYVNRINNTLGQAVTVKYVEISPDQFSSEFVSSLARGTGPDAILISADMILPHEDKLALVPYSALSQRSFIDSYIQEGNIYLNQSGILALPFAVDPMVMYWNRDMYNAAGLASPPKVWDDFSNVIKRITIKDLNGNIQKSALAMGEFDNVDNARELLGTLFLQSGNPVVTMNSDGTPVSTIKTVYQASPIPAVTYFTQFVNPANANYSWNRAMPDAKQAFLSGILATYFGFASEIQDIRSKNPNLNFDVTLVPQLKSGGIKATYGRMYGLSLVRSSPNVNAAYQVISLLTSSQYLSSISADMYLPTVKLDAITAGNSDPYLSIFNSAALVARSWPDADPNVTARIWSEMVENITSGKMSVNEAIQNAGDEQDATLRQALK